MEHSNGKRIQNSTNILHVLVLCVFIFWVFVAANYYV